jgi:hypothetical protein
MKNAGLPLANHARKRFTQVEPGRQATGPLDDRKGDRRQALHQQVLRHRRTLVRAIKEGVSGSSPEEGVAFPSQVRAGGDSTANGKS